jgi:hypothetical protein
VSILRDCAALRAEAKETLACSYLSFTLLLGLAVNAVSGWWWADPVGSTHGSVAPQGGDVKHEMPSGLTCIFSATEYHELDFLSAGRDLAGGAGTAEDG